MHCDNKPLPCSWGRFSQTSFPTMLSAFLVFAGQRVDAETVDCSGIPVLEGPGLQMVEVALPTTANNATIFLLLDTDYGPMALEAEKLSNNRARILLPAPWDDAGSQATSTLLAINDDDRIEWVCGEIETRLLPLALQPGGTDRFAAYLNDLSDQFWPGLALTADEGKLAEISDMFAEMRAEITEMAGGLSDDGLAQTDAFLGAYLGALKDTDPPTVTVAAAPTAGALALLAAAPAPAAPGVSGTILKALQNACPAGPLELTEYIRLGTKARAHTDAAAQFYLTTGLTLAGVSARLFNKATLRNGTADKVIDKSIATVNAMQGLLGDYLAGMMPLNLDKLDITHSNAVFFDDTPENARQVVVTEVQLRTRSDGWSKDKAALDALLGVAGLRSGGAPSGPVSNAVLGPARQNATRLERIAQTVEKQVGTNLAVTNEVRQTARRHADDARIKLEVMEMGVETVQGTVQGQVTGQATGALGNSEIGPFGKQVSHCRIDLTKPEDGSRPRHVFLNMAGGDNTVATPALEPPLALDIVGTGRATALVRLNPSDSTFPIPQARSLPEASFDLEVESLRIRIEGPGPRVAAGEVLEFVATTEGVAEGPRLIWSVSPVMLIEESGQLSERVRLRVPDDLPADTVITLTATAMGSFISDAEQTQQHSVVMSVKQEEGNMSCAGLMAQLVRPQLLASGKNLAGVWKGVSRLTLQSDGYHSATCRPAMGVKPSPGGRPLVIAHDPAGLSLPMFDGYPRPLGRVGKSDFLQMLFRFESSGFEVAETLPPLNTCYAPPGFPSLLDWINSPDTEIFKIGPDRQGRCMGFAMTDDTHIVELVGALGLWEIILLRRE